MADIFRLTERPNADVFYSRGDRNDPRLGDVVGCEEKDFDSADIVILGCPQDEGVRRSGGREGAAGAPEAIRRQFYQLTTFNVSNRVFDLGDVRIGDSLEETHATHCEVAKTVLEAGKRLIVLGGGGDISYADGMAMAEAFGAENWIAVNVDSHIDVRSDEPRNSGTQFRQLLDEGHLDPKYFYEVGFQSHFCSPVYYDYIRKLGVHRISLELLRSRAGADTEIKEQIRLNFIKHSSSISAFFGFDMSAVRAADAPGASATSPLGLRAGEFIQLVKYAASLANTKLVEFSEVNPNFDHDDRTTKLVAIGMHRFCTGSAT